MSEWNAPWRWQGEDYRGGWGWQILVDANGAGIIVGQGIDGGPEPSLRAHVPVDRDLCVTGMAAKDKPHVEPVHVMKTAASLIAAAPDLYAALANMLAHAERSNWIAKPDDEDVAGAARTALQRARGETP